MRNITRWGVLLLVLAANLPMAAADATSRVTVRVLTSTRKKPVANAHVVVRFVKKKLLKDKRTSWETKTNRKGIVVLDNIPQGTVKVQVIARGFQTYGDQHELKEPEEELTILLHPPQGQYSAY